MRPDREGWAVFDKLRKAVSDKVAEVSRAAGLPPDMAAVPDVAGVDLGEVDPAALSAYLGRPVVGVGPLGPGGSEATSFLGARIQERLREASAGRERLPGELVAGQFEATVDRLRASGMPEDQIAMIREEMLGQGRRHTRDGWTVDFGDQRASVQVFGADTEEAAGFDRLRQRYRRENGLDGYRPEEVPTLVPTVQRVKGAPYESYCLSGRLFAAGERHVAEAASPRVATPVLAALAAVALRSVDGR
jgi:hypothetical protein